MWHKCKLIFFNNATLLKNTYTFAAQTKTYSKKMKKILLSFTALVFASSLIFTGCKKDDTEAPEITLIGADPYNLALNTTYSDPGATAEDNEDGEVTVSVDASAVNKDKAGSYEVVYTAVDAAGNEGTATRTVVVANQTTTSAWTGSYSILIVTPGQTNYTYTDGAIISSTLNNHLSFNKFGDYSNAERLLDFKVNGSGTIDIPSQTFKCGTPAVTRTFSGSGSITSGTGGAGSILTLSVAETTNGSTVNSIYTCTKQ